MNDKEEFKTKIRSINFGQAKNRKPKVTVTDTGSAVAKTTEHWDERVDQEITPNTIRLKTEVE